MVVTVPDPVHTHLSLQFDRTLEALQQALQDEKFTYDSSWLPWKNIPPMIRVLITEIPMGKHPLPVSAVQD